MMYVPSLLEGCILKYPNPPDCGKVATSQLHQNPYFARSNDGYAFVPTGMDTPVTEIIIGALIQTLETPSKWSGFANGVAHQLFTAIFQAAKSLDIPSGGNYHIPSGPPPESGDQPSNTPQPPVSHTKEAVIGADNFADADNQVTMKDVLKEVVNVSQTVTQPCE